MPEKSRFHNLLYTDPKERPLSHIQDDVRRGISRVSNIAWHPGVSEPNYGFLQEKTELVLNNLRLPSASLLVIEDLQEAIEFLDQSKRNNSWINAWVALQDDAGDVASYSQRSSLWNNARKDVASVMKDKSIEPRLVGFKDKNRAIAYVQWIVVEDLLPGTNALEPFIEVNEYGGSLLGVMENTFGVYLPRNKRS